MTLCYGLCVLFLNSTCFPRFVHVAVCTFSSLLLTAARESMVCNHHILFIHSPEVGDLDCLPLPAPTDGATVASLYMSPCGSWARVSHDCSWEWNCLATGHIQRNFSKCYQITLPNGCSTLYA